VGDISVGRVGEISVGLGYPLGFRVQRVGEMDVVVVETSRRDGCGGCRNEWKRVDVVVETSGRGGCGGCGNEWRRAEESGREWKRWWGCKW
jgi:hypothetical protein